MDERSNFPKPLIKFFQKCIDKNEVTKDDLIELCGRILDFVGESEYKVINDNFNYQIDQAIQELNKLRR